MKGLEFRIYSGDNNLKHFVKHVFSAADLGLKKDAPQIYALVSEKLGFSPNEILYIDDKHYKWYKWCQFSFPREMMEMRIDTICPFAFAHLPFRIRVVGYYSTDFHPIIPLFYYPKQLSKFPRGV